MRIRSIPTAVFALISILFMGVRTAQADTYLWLGVDPGTGWCDEMNWINLDGLSLAGYPDDEDDKAIVGAGLSNGCVGLCGDITIGALVIQDDGCVFVTDGHTLTITNAGTRNGRLTIEPPSTGGVLIIGNGGTVDLAGNDVTHKIGGDVLLTSATSVLVISGDAKLNPFSGSGDGQPHPVFGKVRGQHNNAQIQIKRGKTLTNNITVCGMMTIKTVP